LRQPRRGRDVGLTAPARPLTGSNLTTALQRSELLKGLAITIVTLKDDMRPTAEFDNRARIDEAIRIARAADGAHAIHDELTLKK
jgi:hyperosmotically inducible periplasmic protein